jgi:hypothetical protein
MTQQEEFTIGQELRVQCTFKNASAALANPTTVTLKIMKPDGTLAGTWTGGDLTNSSAGIFYRDYTPDVFGRYRVRFDSTGTPKVATEGFFDVKISPF